MKTISFFTFALLGLVAVACNPSSSEPDPQKYGFYNLTRGNERDVLINYAGNTLLSIYLAEIVAEKAESERIRESAVVFADGHRRIYKELEKLAADRKVRLPQMFMQRQVDVMKMMRSKEGTALDKTFIQMVTAYDGAFGGQMEKALQEKSSDESVLEFARLVDSRRPAHQAEAKRSL